MSLDFQDKVVVVTGGAQGIGKQIAVDFLKSNATVIILDINEDTLSSVKEELSEYGIVDALSVNVTDFSQVQDTMHKIIDKYSKIDILINNAGITRDNLLLKMKEDEWDSVLTVNLKGVYNCSKAVLKSMVKNRKGKIVNISSIIGLRGNPGQTNYGASKAAIVGFTKSLAREVASRGITVNAVAPGYIKTAMSDNISEKKQKEMAGMIPMNKLGTPADVSNPVRFLASDLAGYITGKVLVVDGGML